MSQSEQSAAIVPDDVGVSETAWQTLDSGAASDVTVRFRLGGIVKHLRILSDAARDADGAPLKIHAVVQDVTAREDSRNEIERLRDQLRSREMTALAEHRLAAQLQNMIQPVPREPVRLPGMEAMVRYLPAESALQVGGDWYHTQALPGDRVVVAIGDVAGHGLGAASAMAHLRYGLVAWLSIGLDDPGVLLGHLNRLCGQLATTCTAVLAVYEPRAGRMLWARAGHPVPLRARSGRAEPLAAPAGLLLGGDDGATYPTAVTDLLSDDLVLLYTDGLVERNAGPADCLKAVNRTLAEASTAIDGQSLTRLVDKLGTPSAHDDTCILAVRIQAA
jgi:serine phosphatase RsbU (regulator of sigma subunit)